MAVKRQAPTMVSLPERLEGESDKSYQRRLAAHIRGDDVRSKGDLREFKTADFSLDHSFGTDKEKW